MSKHISTDEALYLVGKIADKEAKRRTSAINHLQQTINNQLAEKVDTSTYTAGMALKANSSDVYTKQEAEAAITTKVNEASHLKKVKATQDEIDGYIADPSTADKDTIYLLKDLSAEGDDTYKEYTVLGTGAEMSFECIGDTSTDLSDYVKASDIQWATTADINDIIASVYGLDLTLTVTPNNDSTVDLFGFRPDDLQENIAINDSTNAITGTLKYIADYSSAWSGDEASGNYITLKAVTNKTPDRITVEVIGGDHGERALDSDGIAVLRIKNTSQSIRFRAYLGSEVDIKTYVLSDLVLTPAE